MARRRDIRPPFEVMKAAAHAAQQGQNPAEAGPGLSVSPTSGKSETHDQTAGHGHHHGHSNSGSQTSSVTNENWARLRQPIVFRLPPGYALLIGIGALILLIVAFSAGYSQGGSSMKSIYETQQRNEQNIARRMVQGTGAAPGQNATNIPPRAGSGSNASGTNPVTAANGSSASGAVKGVYDDFTMDPRKPNYQYFIVAHCSREEAQRMVDFFDERGVEAAAVISHNRRSQYVVFILRPFTREQTASSEARALKQKIFEWGKVWASREYRGPTNLSDTYMAVYSPKEN